MRTAYVNEVWLKDHEVVRGLIVVNKTIEETLPIIFGKKWREIIEAIKTHPRTLEEGGCHTFTRFCQFVVYFNYDKTLVNLLGGITEIGISIELMYFGTSDNINDVFDYMGKLRNAGWEQSTRDKIEEIAREIKNDYYESWFETAELKVKDPLTEISTFPL